MGCIKRGTKRQICIIILLYNYEHVSCSLVSSSFVDAHPPPSPFALQHLSGQREKTRLFLKISESIGHMQKLPQELNVLPRFLLVFFTGNTCHWFYWFFHFPCFRIHCLKVLGNYSSAQRKGSLPPNQAIRKHHGIGVAMVVIQTPNLPNCDVPDIRQKPLWTCLCFILCDNGQTINSEFNPICE